MSVSNVRSLDEPSDAPCSRKHGRTSGPKICNTLSSTTVSDSAIPFFFHSFRLLACKQTADLVIHFTWPPSRRSQVGVTCFDWSHAGLPPCQSLGLATSQSDFSTGLLPDVERFEVEPRAHDTHQNSPTMPQRPVGVRDVFNFRQAIPRMVRFPRLSTAAPGDPAVPVSADFCLPAVSTIDSPRRDRSWRTGTGRAAES